jgi:transglutaminase-like putative cysteine protease
MLRCFKASLFCALLISSSLTLAKVVFSQTIAPSPIYHIESVTTRHVRCTLNLTSCAPHLAADKWLVIIPQPVNLPGQTLCGESLTIDSGPVQSATELDQSPLHRPVVIAVVNASSALAQRSLNVTASYDVSLTARWLAPGAPLQRVPGLSKMERTAYLSQAPTTDFAAPAFQQWLTVNNLRRLPGEDDLAFAQRTFNKIRSLYSYSYQPNQDRKASSICLTNAADCGGLSNLFVAAIRQAGIPARIDVGRWACVAGSNDELHDMHVKSEFYVEGIGWIPVEMSGAVSNKTDDSSLYFGRDTGQFLTMSVNTDYVIDAHSWGTKHLLALQGICYWSAGTGSFDGCRENDNWCVENLPDAPFSNTARIMTVAQNSQIDTSVLND